MKNSLLFSDNMRSILTHPLMLDSMKYVQHGNISVYTHSVMVAYYSERLAAKLRSKCSRESLVKGALLHDFFMYDWHIPRSSPKQYGLHGFTHPVIAAKNAKEHFDVTRREYDVIIRHMWPLTITRIPKNREGWLVCAIDKYCSLLETLRLAPYSDKQIAETLGVELPSAT